MCPTTEKKWLLVYDVGGSHATAALLEEPSLVPKFVEASPVDSNGDAATILESFHRLGESVIAKAGLKPSDVAGASFAMPGPFDYENGVSHLQHKYQSLYRKSLRAEFSQRFGFAPEDIRFINDAHAFLLGEIHSGGGEGSERTLGITLGTGIGSGFAVSGHIVETGEGVPPNGEIYNLPWNGETIEDTISTRWIQKRYQQLGGQPLSVKEICNRVETDATAAKVMDEFGENLGTVLISVTSVFKPDRIVLGGAISLSERVFLEHTRRVLNNNSCTIVTSKLLDKAALIGAGVHWHNRVSVA